MDVIFVDLEVESKSRQPCTKTRSGARGVKCLVQYTPNIIRLGIDRPEHLFDDRSMLMFSFVHHG